jgi:septum formation protein
MTNPSIAPNPQRTLILASTSRYRRELMERLQWPFEVQSPHVDETPKPNETPLDLALRLAQAKALAVSRMHPSALVIGSDQVADLLGEPLGKPLSHEVATRELERMSGQQVLFHTAVCVSCLESGFLEVQSSLVQVQFRQLNPAEIESYLLKDQPYDCAGSSKSESLGIALVDAIQSDDPTALIGLPLIKTLALLRKAGLNVLDRT